MLKGIVRKKIKKSSFSQREQGSDLKNLNPPIKAPISIKLARNLRDITLKVFIQCYCYNELDLLVISGSPTEEMKKAAFEELKYDFVDMIGGTKHRSYFKCFVDLIALRAQKESIILVSELLRTVYYKPFVQTLNELCETGYEFNPENWEEYLQEIDDACEILRPIRVEIKLKEIEFEAMGDTDNVGEITEDYFYDKLIDISDLAHFHLTDQISAFEFAKRIKKMNEMIDSLNKKQDNGRIEH